MPSVFIMPHLLVLTLGLPVLMTREEVNENPWIRRSVGPKVARFGDPMMQS